MEFKFELEKRIEKFIISNNLISLGDTIIVGISGGADSVFLLHVMDLLKDRLNFSIKAVHVEHGIRGRSSIEDMDFVSEFCRNREIELAVHRIDVPSFARKEKLTLEEAARILRYDAFYQEKRLVSADGNVRIAVAHHKNDLSETVIFNMLRGSGLKGLGGIRSKRDDIVRPLLCVTREEIERYLHEAGIAYRIDETNTDVEYSRNRIRNVIIPEMEKVQSRAVEHICRIAEEAIEAEEYIEEVANQYFLENVKEENGYIIDCSSFAMVPRVIEKSVVRIILKKTYSRLKDITNTHVVDILSLVNQSETKEIALPKGIVAIKTGNHLYIGKKDTVSQARVEDEASEYEIDVKQGEDILLNDGRIMKISVISIEECGSIESITYTKCFDYDKIIGGLSLRTRRDNDYLCINSQMQKKKLKSYFINEKIPSNERKKTLLLTCGDHVLWVIGHRISEYYKIDGNTKNVLKVEIIGGKK